MSPQQITMLKYLLEKGIQQVFIKPETQHELDCANATLTRHQFNNYSATPDQLEAYYKMREN